MHVADSGLRRLRTARDLPAIALVGGGGLAITAAATVEPYVSCTKTEGYAVEW